MSDTLAKTLHQISPRYLKPHIPFPSLIIHSGIALFWVILVFNALWGKGLMAWAIGLVYIGYDTALLLFTFCKTYPLRLKQPLATRQENRPSLTVIIAAFNEAVALKSTIQALNDASEPPENIIIADDGSTDATNLILSGDFKIPTPQLNSISPPGKLRWLRAQHGGKAATLNLALTHVMTELIVTVDADTILAPNALEAMRDAFAKNPQLVAATGVLTPFCDRSIRGQFFQLFQTYEYIRNFLGRYAWGRMKCLVLISGAFAGFRQKALLTVGGFDPDCLVEDYEIVHRLFRYSYLHNLNWETDVIGKARALTSAPINLSSFLKQRRRWFAGFLQTHYWYRDMVGSYRFKKLGLWMLPVKAIDTFQPIFGLSSFVFFIWYALTGKLMIVVPVGVTIALKVVIDLSFHLWSVRTYKSWTESHIQYHFLKIICASIIEPFSFQLLRHLGACWGWLTVLSGRFGWESQRRVVFTAEMLEASQKHYTST